MLLSYGSEEPSEFSRQSDYYLSTEEGFEEMDVHRGDYVTRIRKTNDQGHGSCHRKLRCAVNCLISSPTTRGV
jgi:hypothetical protein